MQIRRRTIQQIQTFAWFAVVYMVIGSVWEYVELSAVSLVGPSSGLAVAVALALLEESRIAAFTRSMSFSSAILVKSLLYLFVIAIPVCSIGFVTGFFQGRTIAEFNDWILSARLLSDLALIYSIHLGIIFLRHLNKLLGPGTLMRYVTGRYHKPRKESRVFMFLDLKSSTTLTEEMGSERYYAFLNTFFRDMSESIVERSAEIYGYVGDEVILTWPLESGIRDANCIRVFVELLAHIHSRREVYRRKFGHVPEFKAAVHFGEVIAAEIGDIKKEISYFGDVLNTTARMQAKCNELGHMLIASEALLARLDLPEFIFAEKLGQIPLRGKAEATALVGLYRA